MFKIGQKVVCKDASNTIGIVKGEIYKIEDITNCICGCGRKLLFINVAKYAAWCSISGMFSGFHSGYKLERFEPLIDDNWAEELVERIIKEINQEELIPSYG